MKHVAVAGLMAACTWVGITYPVWALTALLIFAGLGTVYELLRKAP